MAHRLEDAGLDAPDMKVGIHVRRSRLTATGTTTHQDRSVFQPSYAQRLSTHTCPRTDVIKFNQLYHTKY